MRGESGSLQKVPMTRRFEIGDAPRVKGVPLLSTSIKTTLSILSVQSHTTKLKNTWVAVPLLLPRRRQRRRRPRRRFRRFGQRELGECTLRLG